jgi:hypothetical protein
MSYKTGFYEGRLGIGLGSTMGMGDGNPRYPLDINGDIRLTGSIVNGDGQVLSLVPAESLWTIGNNNLSYAGGNVGIGNSSPEYLLDLADSTYANGGGYPPAEFIRFGTANISPNSSGGLIWKTTYGGSYTKISAKIEAICEADYFRQGLAFFTGNETYTTDATERMRIDMDGNVGIGTTSPDELLHVNVNTSNTAEIYPLIISNDYTFGFNTGNDIGCGIGFKSHWKGDGIDSPTVMTAIESHKESSANFGDSYLSFKTRRESNRSLGGVGVLAERMRIDSVGNVGIGTTSPVSALTIGGTTTTLSDTIITLASDGGSAYKQGIKMIHHGGAPNGGTDATQYGWYMFGSDVTDKLHIGSYNGSSTESDHLVITRSSGNVGIGTTSPGSQCKLQVYETGTEQAWKGRGVFGNETCAFVCGVYHNKIQIGGHNGALNAWYDIAINPGGGNVGIGTTSPAVLLDVNGHGWCRSLCVGSYGSFSSIDGGDGAILQISNSTYNASFGIEFSGYTNGHRGGNQALAKIICWSNDSNNYENHLLTFKIRGWGSGGAPHHNPLDDRFWFYGSGSATASAWNTSSDDRVKHNERNITNAMDIINKLNAKLYFKSNDIKEHDYDYELDNSGNPITDEYYRLQAGFIAQEVREIPELEFCVEGKEYVDDFRNCFKKDASGNNFLDENNEPVLIPEYLGCIPNKLALGYNDIFVYNVVATQELDRKVIALESENAELKAELAAIKQHLGI